MDSSWLFELPSFTDREASVAPFGRRFPASFIDHEAEVCSTSTRTALTVPYSKGNREDFGAVGGPHAVTASISVAKMEIPGDEISSHFCREGAMKVLLAVTTPNSHGRLQEP